VASGGLCQRQGGIAQKEGNITEVLLLHHIFNVKTLSHIHVFKSYFISDQNKNSTNNLIFTE
jgi:hypothetical protein